MGLDEKALARLEELIERADRVLATQIPGGSDGGFRVFDLNVELARQWSVSSLHLLERVFGEDSVHYKQFVRLDKINFTSTVREARGILQAAKDDYKQGMLFDTRNVITAEVFEDFLEQAEYLLSEGNYYGPAAVIAGCVLEDGLRQLCARNNITVDGKATLNTLNTALYKAQVYGKGAFKQNDYLGTLRNDAAHGYWDRFGPPEVDTMIRQVRAFMLQHFS